MASLPRPRKHRSSTNRSNAPPIDGSAELLEASIKILEESDVSREKSRAALNQLNRLLDNTIELESLQDHFRRLHGFQASIVLVKKHVAGLQTENESRAVQAVFHDVQQLLHLLLLAFRDHEGNRRYFARRVDGGGWASLKELIASFTSLVSTGSFHTENGWPTVPLIGSLLALTISDPQLKDLFEIESIKDPQVPDGNAEITQLPDFANLQTNISSAAAIVTPEAIPILLGLPNLQRDDVQSSTRLNQVVLTALQLIRHWSSLSLRNRQLIAECGLAEDLTTRIAKPSTSNEEVNASKALLVELLSYNSGDLTVSERLFKDASTHHISRQVLEHSIARTRDPSCIHFDLSQSGHSSLEFASIPRSFPPPTGYSLEVWARFNRFDPSSHTTIFGAFDATQTCFVLAYLERNTQQLILQTSVNLPSPSVRFKRTQFLPDTWYHICLIHRPPKAGSFGEVLLFVNGRYVERKEKCLYPQTAPSSDGETSSAPFPPQSEHARRPVQVFFGTPQSLAPRTDGQRTESSWSLGTAHLYDCCLNRDLVAVHYSSGPGYSGNYQDRVGQLLTYDASAALNRYNEELYGEKAEKSGIVTTIQRRGIDALHEGTNLVSVFSSATVSIDGIFSQAIPLTAALPENAAKQLQQITRSGNTVVINTGRPLVADALTRPAGLGILTGGAFVSIPQTLDDASWRLSGFISVQMMLIESAVTPNDLRLSLKTLFNGIKPNFRTSEAMEREHGYSLVSLLLREKLGLANHVMAGSRQVRSISFSSAEERSLLMLDLLKIILPFVGIDTANPGTSLLTNPMAYRSFLTDFDTWRSGSIGSQKLYYQQFSWLLIESYNMDFNAKRLAKMRIVRKFLDCIRSDRIHVDNLQEALRALRALYEYTASKIDHRDLATFVGYCLQEGKNASQVLPARRPTIRMDLPNGRTGSPPILDYGRLARLPDEITPDKSVSKGHLGTAVLSTYAELLCDPTSAAPLRRFYRHVPVSWLLHLLGESDSQNVATSLKIICRSIVAIGPEFLTKLSSKNAGLVVVEERLKTHWRSSSIWLHCLSALFGADPSTVEPLPNFTCAELQRRFPSSAVRVPYPEIAPWLFGLMEAAIAATDLSTADEETTEAQSLVTSVIEFFIQLQATNASFRDFTISSQYLRELLRLLYPLIASTELLRPSAELGSVNLPATGKPRDVVLRPHSNSVSGRPTIIRAGSSVTLPERPSSQRIRTPRRPSSFVLVDADDKSEVRLAAHFTPVMAPIQDVPIEAPSTSDVTEKLLKAVEIILIGQTCSRKDYSGFGLFLKVPPGDQLHQAYFESYVLMRTMSSMWTTLSKDEELLQSPRTLTNLARYSLHMAEAVFEGWFIDGAQPLVDFTGKVLDYVQQPHVASLKDVRLCSQAVSTTRTVFLRIVLLRLSELDETQSDSDTLAFLKQLAYYQTILFAPENQETTFIRLICYALYTKLVSNSPAVRMATAGLFRMLLVQKPTEAATILIHSADADQKHLSTGFMKLATHDDEELLAWVDARRAALDKFFIDSLSKYWEEFVDGENKKTEESAKNRVAKRREKLKQWEAEETNEEEVLQQAERATGHWRINSHAQDRMKLNRTIQDQQENINHLYTTIARQHELMRQPCGLTPDTRTPKWQLDQTEARDRMRTRLIRDTDRETHMYQPKRKASGRASPGRPGGMQRSTSGHSVASQTQARARANSTRSEKALILDGEGGLTPEPPNNNSSMSLLEGDFELVDDPRDDEEVFEDKNRKIMRSVERGDSIKSVYNVSRIVGLEACEGLLIIGRKWLYMRDNMFQRSDGEIVSINSAPWEERDHYVQMISGKQVQASRVTPSNNRGDVARSWSWKDVLSMSKRRFLFRDVAVEVFFNDGRSYLLIFANPTVRNSVYNDISTQAPHIIGPTSSMSEEDQWRIDCLRSPEDVPQTLGNKFASVFNSAATNAATRKWVRGEISNFHYLMLVNTMAGRTYNDLTQYPVFPWVLSDYTSEELNLDDPRSYRDLSKPMGCQHPSREADYRERYQSFADMGEENPFHYGTHYSSAMIVTSYLIRLQPFVQSYLLLQGGTFDHADRLFDSIEKTWTSASKQNMTDVRELTPEFYYLPELLTNINGYDFGIKEGTGQAINDVQLPPWAKGDPHLFIRKHREALESPHVSEHLHEWIDLIFGYKQKGEAAVDATNMFHPLSYHGAKDLDTIDDPVERLATIGIIHNFGQTPHQVFTRPHPRREAERFSTPRLDTLADTLTKLPKPAAELSSRVSSILPLTTSKLLTSGPCKLYSSPTGRFFAQHQYADSSLRFFDTDTRKLLGLYEALHVGPISTALFLDSRTLLTGGADSVIGIFDLTRTTNDNIDLRPRLYLHGHRARITHLSAARAFATLVSADAHGRVIIWDLNRGDCVHLLRPPSLPPTSRDITALEISDLTGHILLAIGNVATLYTLNGHKLLEQRLCDADDVIGCAAFYEGTGGGGEWVRDTVLFTGHKRGVVRVWTLTNLSDGSWHLGLVKQLSCAEVGREGTAAAVSCVKVGERGIWVGDEGGRVVGFGVSVRG
ncbi:beige/BEACH domain-containing protein [Elsinoe australis]|uniref:Beige/BEACH domain-containing protein n=1 Tax=Elsinoe australis TaxID=40998 RepID=A0A4U7AXV7_9PEZI|nr:beige/BEACH domain-containing protein [Elsinoe australis]